MVSAWVQGLVRWLSYFLGGSDPSRAAFPAFQQRFPGLTQADYQQAWEETQRGIAAIIRFAALREDQPLSAALAGEEPPAQMVELRALITWTGGSAPKRKRLVFVEVPWDMPAGLAYERLRSEAATLGEQYEAAVTGIEVIAPLRYPR